MNEAVEQETQLRCPHCDSHELFEKVKGQMSICLVCFKIMKLEPETTKWKISWPSLSIIGGIAAGLIAGSALAATAVYEIRQEQQVRTAPANVSNVAPTVKQYPMEQMSGRLNPFGDKPWYRGFMDRADSCELLPANVTPKDDIDADGGHAYIVHAETDEKEYSLFYSTGQRVWVYSSSENECRRAVNNWIWSHTVSAADGGTQVGY